MFDVTFGCHYRAIKCIKIAATSADEASKLAESVLQNVRVEPGEETPPDFLNSMGATQLVSSKLLGIRPERDPKVFDMCGADFGTFLGREKPADKTGA